MLQAVTLFLSLSAAPALAQAPGDPQDRLALAGELKDVPAQGATGPTLLCEGTTNLPNGVSLVANLYYGKPVEGRELFRGNATIKGGRFSHSFPVFSTRNFPGPYVARLVYDPVLQGLEAPNYPRTTVDLSLKIGGPQDIDREGQSVRNQLVAEIRALLAIADEMKAKVVEMKGKPQADREAAFTGWHEKSLEISARMDPRKHPEFFILNLDLVAHTAMEDLSATLISAARCFVRDQPDVMAEGLTRLRQSCEYWIGEVGRAKVQDVAKLAESVEECRSIARKLLESPDDPVLPARRRFLELIGTLDKSAPVVYHDIILTITDRAASFFTAAADKSPDAKALHAELDSLLNRFAGTLRTHDQ